VAVAVVEETVAAAAVAAADAGNFNYIN